MAAERRFLVSRRESRTAGNHSNNMGALYG